jgi:hypothetical protein
MKITYSNDFHGTSTTVRVHDNGTGRYYLSARQVKRARNALCGIVGCTCGGVLGERGTNHGDGTPCQWPVEDLGDGTAMISRPY